MVHPCVRDMVSIDRTLEQFCRYRQYRPWRTIPLRAIPMSESSPEKASGSAQQRVYQIATFVLTPTVPGQCYPSRRLRIRTVTPRNAEVRAFRRASIISGRAERK